MFLTAVGSLEVWTAVLLIAALLIAFGFEFVNGFHDTANAVATVIYTNTLRPWAAVLTSGVFNFLGVFWGGVAVAFSIVNLLPVDLLIGIDGSLGLAMVLSLLISAILWNLGTWLIGLPTSSSHTLIGAILGVGVSNSLIQHGSLIRGVNWHKAIEVGGSLLVAPIVGFLGAVVLLLLAKRLIPNPTLYTDPPKDQAPPGWIRYILILTCSGVSFSHGSNDGQKGMGLILLILVGLLPGWYCLNLQADRAQVAAAAEAVSSARAFLFPTQSDSRVVSGSLGPDQIELLADLDGIERMLHGRSLLDSIAPQDRWSLRNSVLRVTEALNAEAAHHPADQKQALLTHSKHLRRLVEYVPVWVQVGVALTLGIGTMIGWKRIVITVAEKIGKSHLTYAQGASAELVAMATIGFSSASGFPVSTTHVLSSGVAGTMWANSSGLQFQTIRKIALAWILTLPACIVLSGTLYAVARWLLVHSESLN